MFDGVVWADEGQIKTFLLYPEVLSMDSTGMTKSAAHGCVSDSGALAQGVNTHTWCDDVMRHVDPHTCVFVRTAQTNKHAMPLFLAVGIDGNGKSFVVFGALILNETAATYQWVFETARVLLGERACAAVRYIVTDDDHGERSALKAKVCDVLLCAHWFLSLFLRPRI